MMYKASIIIAIVFAVFTSTTRSSVLSPGGILSGIENGLGIGNSSNGTLGNTIKNGIGSIPIIGDVGKGLLGNVTNEIGKLENDIKNSLEKVKNGIENEKKLLEIVAKLKALLQKVIKALTSPIRAIEKIIDRNSTTTKQ